MNGRSPNSSWRHSPRQGSVRRKRDFLIRQSSAAFSQRSGTHRQFALHVVQRCELRIEDTEAVLKRDDEIKAVFLRRSGRRQRRFRDSLTSSGVRHRSHWSRDNVIFPISLRLALRLFASMQMKGKADFRDESCQQRQTTSRVLFSSACGSR